MLAIAAADLVDRAGGERAGAERKRLCRLLCRSHAETAVQRVVAALVAKSKMIDGSAVSAASALCRLLCGRRARSVPTVPAFPTGENAPVIQEISMFLDGWGTRIRT
jgi:hypothetical protein